MPRVPRVFAEPPERDGDAGTGDAPLEPAVDEIPVGEVGAGPAGRWSHHEAPPGPGLGHGPIQIPATPVPPPFPSPVPLVSGSASWAPPDEDAVVESVVSEDGSWAPPDEDAVVESVGSSVPGALDAPGLVDAGEVNAGEVNAGEVDAHNGAVSQLRAALDDLEDILHVDAETVLGGDQESAGDGLASSVGASDAGGLEDLFDDWSDDAAADDPVTGQLVGHVERARVGSEIGAYEPPVQRRIDYGRAGDLVDRITGYIGNRPQLAQRVTGFQLTRDAQLDANQRVELEHIVTRELKDVALPVTAAELPEVLDVVYDELIGLGPLGVVWRDPAVTEILVDGWDNIYVEVGGRLRTTSYRFRSAEHAEGVARGLAERVSGRTLSPTNSLVTAELPAARVNFAYKPVVRSGLAITLRKLDGVMGMAKLLEHRSLTEEMAAFLSQCVSSRAAILVSGGTGVGKTTLLNALSESIGAGERVVTIEDSYELRLANRFVVSMQTKEAASGDDTIFVTQDQLLRNSLRMRPDRIVVGEMRDGEAAAVMLAAANTGHEGTMTTIHANTADSAVNVRLTNMARAGADIPTDVARWEIAEAFDLVVQGTRSHYDGQRFVSEIAEVTTAGLDEGGRIHLRPIFRATMHPDAPVEFHQVGGVDPGGRLAERLQSSGFDIGMWVHSDR